MGLVYLVFVIVINLMGVEGRFIDGINSAFNTDMTGTTMFFVGLMITFILSVVFAGHD